MAEPKVPYPHPPKVQHRVPGIPADDPNLAFLSLVEHKAETRVSPENRHWLDRLRHRWTSLDHGPRAHSPQTLAFDNSLDERLVFFFDLVPRVHNPLCPIAVIGEQ